MPKIFGQGLLFGGCVPTIDFVESEKKSKESIEMLGRNVNEEGSRLFFRGLSSSSFEDDSAANGVNNDFDNNRFSFFNVAALRRRASSMFKDNTLQTEQSYLAHKIYDIYRQCDILGDNSEYVKHYILGLVEALCLLSMMTPCTKVSQKEVIKHLQQLVFSFCNKLAQMGFIIFSDYGRISKLIRNDREENFITVFPEALKFLRDRVVEHPFYNNCNLSERYKPNETTMVRSLSNVLGGSDDSDDSDDSDSSDEDYLAFCLTKLEKLLHYNNKSPDQPIVREGIINGSKYHIYEIKYRSPQPMTSVTFYFGRNAKNNCIVTTLIELANGGNKEALGLITLFARRQFIRRITGKHYFMEIIELCGKLDIDYSRLNLLDTGNVLLLLTDEAFSKLFFGLELDEQQKLPKYLLDGRRFWISLEREVYTQFDDAKGFTSWQKTLVEKIPENMEFVREIALSAHSISGPNHQEWGKLIELLIQLYNLNNQRDMLLREDEIPEEKIILYELSLIASIYALCWYMDDKVPIASFLGIAYNAQNPTLLSLWKLLSPVIQESFIHLPGKRVNLDSVEVCGYKPIHHDFNGFFTAL